MPFERVVQSRVLDPVGLTDASFDPQSVELVGHLPKGTAPTRTCRAMRPSGGLVLSVGSLSKWARQLADPETSPLGDELIALLTAPHVATGEGQAYYGYGVVRKQFEDVTLLHHSGALHGYSAFVAWVPERRFGVAAMANRFGPMPAVACQRLTSTLLDLPFDSRPERVAAHELDQYTGVYIDTVGDLGTIAVTLEKGQLAIDYPLGSPERLPPTFRFAFGDASSHAQYIVTAVGVGHRAQQ
jgi:CubicO group peptidase (beta-lactamase class C family)